MPEITTAEVEKNAQLGRLALTDAEVKKATADLSNVLDHFSTIQKVDTAQVPTFDEVGDVKNKTRNDDAKPNALTTREELLSRAPQLKDSQVQVHAVFKE